MYGLILDCVHILAFLSITLDELWDAAVSRTSTVNEGKVYEGHKHPTVVTFRLDQTCFQMNEVFNLLLVKRSSTSVW